MGPAPSRPQWRSGRLYDNPLYDFSRGDPHWNTPVPSVMLLAEPPGNKARGGGVYAAAKNTEGGNS
jgi:hypothetical protein